ncbi:MAG: SpoIID/LytB domain-containing protein [Microcystaceae cyanobacterium]
MKRPLTSLLMESLRLLGLPFIALISLPFILASGSDTPSEPEPSPQAASLPVPSQLQPLAGKVPPPPSDLLQSPQLKRPAPAPKSTTTSKISSPTPKKPVVAPKATTQASKTAIPSPAPVAVPVSHVNLDIRVAILRNVPNTTLGASSNLIISDRNGNQLTTLKSGESRNISPQGQSLRVGNQSLAPVLWVESRNGDVIYVGDRWYRGKILLVSQGSSLLAVNYVNLEHYLYSVVGSEMHANAPTEALKAQAIAARSYALVHIIRPANPWYDLGNTQRWQVYKGIKSEYNTTQQAVQATMGQILSYKGGVVESLYAATDEIVARAHRGRGMSQIGAYQLARQGHHHQQILTRYYPGVTLARVILE